MDKGLNLLPSESVISTTVLSGLETIPKIARLLSSSSQKEAHALHTFMCLREHTLLLLSMDSSIISSKREVSSSACHGQRYNFLLLNKISFTSSQSELAQPTTTSSLPWTLPSFSNASQRKRKLRTLSTESVLISLMSN